jgi:3-deoxy-manno-octulosonate cytidylyltransferase (CMP-KDO synthetase)
MSTIAIIPARFASTRFPGKPLVRDTGKYLIQHVYERVAAAPGIDGCLVATDDERIAAAVRGFGGRVEMTRADHPSGTDRIAEVADRLSCDVVLNIQGDEPELSPGHISRLAGLLPRRTDCEMGTLACPFRNVPAGDPQDPNAVKVLVDPGLTAVTFSRENLASPGGWPAGRDPHPLLHLGVYAYRREFLLTFARLAPTPLERSRRLEQMRAIEHGWPIAVELVDEAAVGIDTPADYAAFVQRQREKLMV